MCDMPTWFDLYSTVDCGLGTQVLQYKMYSIGVTMLCPTENRIHVICALRCDKLLCTYPSKAGRKIATH